MLEPATSSLSSSTCWHRQPGTARGLRYKGMWVDVRGNVRWNVGTSRSLFNDKDDCVGVEVRPGVCVWAFQCIRTGKHARISACTPRGLLGDFPQFVVGGVVRILRGDVADPFFKRAHPDRPSMGQLLELAHAAKFYSRLERSGDKIYTRMRVIRASSIQTMS